uniref:NYN domain-containing protein n=2 Tax=Brassica campestris TaxID=3711 RepID=M4EJ43_BRACM
MGEEGKIIEFESARQTLLFWNMDDYPIPVDTTDDLGAVSSNMFEALHLMGFLGYMRMQVYSEQPNSEDWLNAEMSYAPKCKSYSAAVYEFPDIALYIIRLTTSMGPGPLNVALIAKPNGELRRVLQCLKSRNHDVLLIDSPPSCPPLFSVESLLEHARLLDGAKPRFKALLPNYMYVDDIDEEYLDIKEDLSKTVDFTERIPTVKGDRTAVFWDAEDYPFPLCSTPDEIYHSIASALVERGSSDKITIWAYLDDDKKGSWRDALLGGNKEWASRIYFLPGDLIRGTMGEEGKIIDFESGRLTLLFWNMDDYPIPVGTSDDLGAVSSNMFEALHQMGFRGYMRMQVYSEQQRESYDKDWWMKSLISYVPKCKSYSADFYKLPDITLDIITLTSSVGPGPSNVALIAKPNGELLRVLRCLKSRGHDVLVIDTPPCCPPLFSVESLLEHARLLDGAKPRFKALLSDYMYLDDIDEKDVEIQEDLSKTVDFSERIPTVKGIRTAVFWDAVDCPFPLSSSPDEIYHSISSALVERGSSDKITIWAYLDDDDKKVSLGGNKEWASRIHFLPGGDSRRNRMLNDIYLWVRDSPRSNRRSCDTNLLIFSDQFHDDAYFTDVLQQLSKKVYRLLLVTPTQDINEPESPAWPGLLIDEGAYCFRGT